MAVAGAERAQSVTTGTGRNQSMNQVQNKYLGDRSTPGNGCCDRWTLVVCSEPALLGALHWMADDHFVGPKLEASSELLHEIEWI